MSKNGMSSPKSIKPHYNQAEAARALDISVDQLRLLIRSHIAEKEADLRNLSRASFHPSDLLVLKILSGIPTGPTTAG